MFFELPKLPIIFKDFELKLYLFFNLLLLDWNCFLIIQLLNSLFFCVPLSLSWKQKVPRSNKKKGGGKKNQKKKKRRGRMVRKSLSFGPSTPKSKTPSNLSFIFYFYLSNNYFILFFIFEIKIKEKIMKHLWNGKDQELLRYKK